MLRLTVGDSTAPVPIHARFFWNKTGVFLGSGERYSMRATGTWYDFGIPCGPDGYDRWYLRWATGLRRLPAADWFFLIGALDSNLESSFRIGSNATVTSSADGELTCFANDIEAMYWNNWGIVDLIITRTA